MSITQPGQPGGFTQPDPGWVAAYDEPGTPPAWSAGHGRFDPHDPLISADYAGWWARGWAALAANWRPLLALQLIGLVIGLVVVAPADVFVALADRDASLAGEPVGAVRHAVAGGSGLLAAIPQLLLTLAGIRLIVAVAAGGQARLGRELAAAARRMLPALGWFAVGSIIIVAALFACLLPVFYVGAVLLILPAVVVFERTGAISRCFRLFNGDLGAAAGRTATMIGLVIAILVAATVLSELVAFAIRSVGTASDTGTVVAATLASTIIFLIAEALYGLILIPFTVVTYADLRARYEPVSTKTLARGLGSGSRT
ncbi:MAG TPA: hypothetical protein VK453_07500 [Micromonosporaceae bacterium]|nr:hypothetical protein [Micromonosporaceae bacterium]